MLETSAPVFQASGAPGESKRCTLLNLALEIAAAGWPVFPCSANCRPAISKETDGHGFQDASRDPEEVKRLFGLAPQAKLIGVPTGQIIGLDALNFDYRNGAEAWEQANAHRLPVTRAHRTKSGGKPLAVSTCAGRAQSREQI
ncbi:MAG: bifunctional DNA primase/polymerase, partial [Acetobacteraceae bacterium]|nr:bifunctional DNA primase/polymerase [Acetobacteraceae bacterium]